MLKNKDISQGKAIFVTFLVVMLGVFLANGVGSYIVNNNDLPEFVSETMFPTSLPYLLFLFAIIFLLGVLIIRYLPKRK